MKKTRFLVLFLIVSSLLISAAAPADAALQQSTLVRLTLVNRTDNTITLWLSGTAHYYLRVEGKTTETFTVQRGSYDYTLYACGAYAKNTLDASRHTRLVMPVCGGAAGGDKKAGRVDLSKTIKVVKVSIENDTPGNAFIILTGPSTYVFTFKARETKTYTINRGEYNMQLWACGRYGVEKVFVKVGSELELDCP